MIKSESPKSQSHLQNIGTAGVHAYLEEAIFKLQNCALSLPEALLAKEAIISHVQEFEPMVEILDLIISELGSDPAAAAMANLSSFWWDQICCANIDDFRDGCLIQS